MKKKIGIAGLGTIGKNVANRITRDFDNAEVIAVTSGNAEKTARNLAEIGCAAQVMDAEAMTSEVDIIIECAPTAAFVSIAEPAVRKGKTLITVSAAALIENMYIVDLAKEHGGKIVMATGALLGLDAVRAAVLGTINEVTMTTRKPPKSLKGAPGVIRSGVNLDALTEPVMLFSGTAREGAREFPANVNVAAALALAGLGPDKTKLQIWADPALERNTHFIDVDADSASFHMSIQNIPSPEKPGTGKITALSMLAALKAEIDPVKIGS